MSNISLRSSYESNYSSSSTKKFIKITSTGNLDLELTLQLNSQEAQMFGVFPDKIHSITDCEKFLTPFSEQMHHVTFKSDQFTNLNIFDFIRLSSKNLTINSLLVLNRATTKKAFIEFVLLSDMRFSFKNAFLKDVVKTVCENNFLFLVENKLLPNLNAKVKFTIKIDNRFVKAFENICEDESNDNQDNESKSNNEGIKSGIDTEAHNNYFNENENENENEIENQKESMKEANGGKSKQGSKITQKSDNEVKMRVNRKENEAIENNVENKINSDNNLTSVCSNPNFDYVKNSFSNRDNVQVNSSISKKKEDNSRINANENDKEINLTRPGDDQIKKSRSTNSLITQNNYDSILENENENENNNQNDNQNKESHSNKHSLNNNLNFQEQLIADQAELIELEKELAQNQLVNESHSRLNYNNELDETTNKILDSIPNEARNENSKYENLDNQSKISIDAQEGKAENKPSEASKAAEEDQNSGLQNKRIAAVNSNNEIIIEENFYRHSFNKQEINENDESKVLQSDNNNLKSKNSLKSRNTSLKSVSNLNSLKSPDKIYSLNESPIKTDRAFNQSNSEAARKLSKNSLNASTSKLNNNNDNNHNNTGSFSLSLREKEAADAYEKFNYDFSASDYFFIDLNDILNLKAFDFSLSNFNSLLGKIAEIHKQIKIIINFPDIVSKIALLDLSAISFLTEIISLTDIFLFEKKDALALFNLLAQLNSESASVEEKKNLEHLFIKEVKKKRKALPKIGIFQDGFKKATIIEQQASSNLVLFHTDYEFNLVPRNAAKPVADTYKKLFVVHGEHFKSIFYGGLFSQLLYKKPFPAAFTAANESLKKILDLKRFGSEPPLDPNFYLVKISKDPGGNLPKNRNSAAAIEEKNKQRKEQRFVLDCGNVMNSQMKEYNSLFDGNLSGYFSSRKVRGHLQKQGFISKKNEIIEDPDAKKLGVFESPKLSKTYEEEKANLLKIRDKKEKLRLQIKNLLQGDNLVKSGNMTEIKSLTKVFNFSPQAIKKLPQQRENNSFNLSSFKKELQKKINFRTSDLTYKQVENRIKQASKSKGKGGLAPVKRQESQKPLLQTLARIEDSIIFDAEFKAGSFKGSLKGSFNCLNSTSVGGSYRAVILEEEENKSNLNNDMGRDSGVDFKCKQEENEKDEKAHKNFISDIKLGSNNYENTSSFHKSRNTSKLTKLDSHKQTSSRSIRENADNSSKNNFTNENDNNLNFNNNYSTIDLNLDTKDKKLSADNSKIIMNSNSLNDEGKAKITKTNNDVSYMTSKDINNKSRNMQIESENQEADTKQNNSNNKTNSKLNLDCVDANAEDKSLKNENLSNLSKISQHEMVLSANDSDTSRKKSAIGSPGNKNIEAFNDLSVNKPEDVE